MKVTLTAARINAGLKQQEVADKLGIQVGTINRWENNKTIPNAKQFIALCNLYQIQPSNIFLP